MSEEEGKSPKPVRTSERRLREEEQLNKHEEFFERGKEEEGL